MSTTHQSIRRSQLLKSLEITKPGIEISPLFRPTALKGEHNVFYTDYTAAEDSRQKHSNYVHDDIVDIDFVWTPGIKLVECAPDQKYHWAIASHVLEHVPDPVGWMLEVFEVLEDGAVFSLALPDKRYCYDLFRRETEVSDLIDNWVRAKKIPSPLQIYDFLSRSVNNMGEPDSFRTTEKFEDAVREYSDQDALNFVFNSWTTGTYLDVHCSVFTPESFVYLIERLNDLGVLNVEVSTPELGKEEFFVTLRKKGEPRISHPGFPHALANSQNEQIEKVRQELTNDVQHARKAFEEAVKIQEQMKATIFAYEATIASLEKRTTLASWFSNWLRRAKST